MTTTQQADSTASRNGQTDLVRAFSLLDVKAFDADERKFSGIATAPAVDRMGDVVNPLGVKFTNPLILLHQHDHTAPIGRVVFGKPTKAGISFEAEIPAVEEPGPLKDRVDTAWLEVKYKLVQSVSIGFRAIKWSYRDDDGIDYDETEIYELSTVSVPALPQAVITSVKSMAVSDSVRRYLAGTDRRVVSLVKGANAARAGSVRLVTG